MKGRVTIFLITVFLSVHFTAFTQAIRIGIPSGHTDFLRCAVFSPDGKYILTASDDCTAKIWDVTSGKLLHNLTGHSSIITSAKYSPDGKKIVTASEDNTARVWDASTGKLLFVLKGHSGRVNSASFSPNNTTIVTASLDGTLKLWNSNTGVMIHSSENSGSSADLAQYSPDGKYIASALEGPAIEIFESSTAGMIRGIQEFGLITSLKFSPAFPGKSSWSNELLITTEYQRTSLWDFKTGKLIQSFAHEAPVYEACFSPDGKYLATAGGKNIKVWDRSNGKLIRTLEGHTDDVRSVEFSPACADDPSGGRYIVSASYDRTAKIYDSHSGELLFNLTGHNDLVWEAHFSPDGRYIITASFDHTARLWNRSNGKLVNILEGHTAKVLSARFSPATTEDPTGGKYAVTSISAGRAESWESNSGKPFHIYGIPSDTAYDAYFSPDGLSVAVTCIHDHLKMYESSGNLRYNITGHKGYIKSVEFSPSTEEYPAGGKYMTTASYDNTASIWDTDSGKWISTLGHDYYIYSAKFSPDGNYIATASADGTASIWTVEGYYRQSFGNSSSSYIRPVYMAEFSPPDQEDPAGGKYLLTAESTDKAVIWESSSGEQVRTLEGHFDNVWSARYSSDGKFIVTASDDSTSIIWENSTGNMLHKLGGHQGGVNSAIFSPDDKLVITASNYKDIKVWDAGSGALLHDLAGHTGKINNIDINATGERLISSSDDGSFIFWNILSGKMLARQIPFDNNSYLTLTYDNYYSGSKDAVKQLCWIVDNAKIYPFEQFDLQYNRPDLVLQRMGNTDTTLIRMYYKAYLKRLQKMKFNESMFSPDFHMPVISFPQSDKMPLTTTNARLPLQIKASDSKYSLDRINVWVNEVPVFGINGIPVGSLKKNTIDKDINVELSRGENKIQVSCLNEKGVESLRESLWITYQPVDSVKEKLYLAVISVSEYADSRYNLKYAVKDGRDIVSLFSSGEGPVIIDTLFNLNVTRDNILAMKQKLMESKIDDQVILYVSGHGLLDQNFDFYFATGDMNFEKPAERGILYEDLEALLDSIPARKKLMFMDACHSGEVDKEEIRVRENEVALADGKRGDIKAYGYKGGTRINTTDFGNMGQKNSFELMQELFTNLSRGSGAVVISAAAGTGYALESDEWNNGVFTYCILDGLKNLAADSNGDKKITVTELKDYVSKEVERLTAGVQKPTDRRESLEFNWRLR